MKVTYLDHSGFAVETESVILVFDYYRDPSHSLTGILQGNKDLPVIFFVSHHHPDHFNRDIFNMAQDHKRVYVLSDDIFSRLVHDDLAVAWMRAGDSQTGLPGGVSVRAFGSTDVGVSYLVTTAEGHTLFHAGDLNYWHWQDESSEKEVKEAYNKYVVVVQDILRVVNSVDVLFFPVDPRLGTDYGSGARLFLENVQVRYFFPMHFFGDWEAACSFSQYVTDNTDFESLCEPGQSVVLTL